MSAGIVTCDECGADVLRCDNAVLLDVPAVERDEVHACWTVMQLGPLLIAGAGGSPSADGRGHTLHEHQPEEAA